MDKRHQCDRPDRIGIARDCFVTEPFGFTMAVPSTFAFFLGMVFIVCGTGLLKPNVSTIVGDLYPEGGARRDAEAPRMADRR